MRRKPYIQNADTEHHITLMNGVSGVFVRNFDALLGYRQAIRPGGHCGIKIVLKRRWAVSYKSDRCENPVFQCW
jgi:hypothetical protein